jgi:hypothetical protein
MDASFAQRLVNTGLVGAERTPALQHQGDNFERKMPFGGCDTGFHLNNHGVLSISGAKCQRPDQDADGNLDCEDR